MHLSRAKTLICALVFTAAALPGTAQSPALTLPAQEPLFGWSGPPSQTARRKGLVAPKPQSAQKRHLASAQNRSLPAEEESQSDLEFGGEIYIGMAMEFPVPAASDAE